LRKGSKLEEKLEKVKSSIVKDELSEVIVETETRRYRSRYWCFIVLKI
jgi:hypothetical protein